MWVMRGDARLVTDTLKTWAIFTKAYDMVTLVVLEKDPLEESLADLNAASLVGAP